jgi:hypothetical protein
MSQTRPLLSRFLSAAVLAGVIGSLLVSYQWSHAAAPSPAAPASAAMMQLLRDEHGLVAMMVSTRLATEKQQLAAGAGRVAAGPRQPTVVR